MFESLESRVLFAGAKVDLVIADNGGEVHIRLNAPVQAEMVNKGSVQMYTAGADSVMNTADDVRILPHLRYIAAENRIVIRAEPADLPVNTPYRIKLVATRMRDSTLTPIDGEFNGNLPSGNGKAGGNFEFVSRPDTSDAPVVRMASNAGVINVQLAKDVVEGTVNNFLAYVNSGRFDGTIIHRNGRTESSPIAIVQGGGYTGTAVDGSDVPTQEIDTDDPIALEENGLDNNRGTISMARTSVPDSATSQFFFNIEDNDFLNSTGADTGYCAFGTVTTASEATIDAIYDADTVAPNATFGTVPQIASANIFFRRVAMKNTISAVTLT